MSQKQGHARAGIQKKKKPTEKIKPHQCKWDTASSEGVARRTLS